MAAIALNARFYSHVPTGMQRYGLEMAKRLRGDLQVIRPDRPLRGMAGHLWEQLYLPAATRGNLLWSPNNTGPLAVARQVCTIHDIIPVEHPEWFSPRFAAWYKFLLPRLAHRVQHIVAVSEFTKQRLVERFGIAPSKVSVVWNGVDEEFSPRPEWEVEQVRAELGIGVSGRYLLTVGSLEPRKNLHGLMAAWRRVSRDLPEDVSLVVAGAKGASLVFSDPKVGLIPPRVHFTGYVNQDQLPALYSGALGMIYVSRYEGFGLPALEAMACGTAVVASNTTSLPEVCAGCAVLVDPLNCDSIAEGIRSIVIDAKLRERLTAAGLAHASNWSWDRCATDTFDILSEFAGARPRVATLSPVRNSK
jgi:glycosyltransferase involved in cell wall biosynthesis